MARSVSVRMYNVGFGDAFLVTVHDGTGRWRMLVDCGVHSHGRARPLETTVHAIIDDLQAASDDGVPRLDVIAATHHHADHIAGFQFDRWADVEVGEVWVPFVEDPDDEDAKELRKVHRDVTRRLTALVDQRTNGLSERRWPTEVRLAQWFAANSSGNELAADRLLGRNGSGFASRPRLRFLPSLDADENLIDLPIAGAVVHVLGPPRDPTFLKRMDPPKRAGWHALDEDQTGDPGDRGKPLFESRYLIDRRQVRRVHPQLLEGHDAITGLDELNDAALLAAASVLERSVNNTSLFFVLDVGGVRLLFPGDAQYGGWEHIMGDEEKRALIEDVAFLKISHHGSHNGTPPKYVDDLMRRVDAMLPYGLVEAWKETIPLEDLLKKMKKGRHRVTRADAPVARRGKVTVHGDLWSEIRFPVPTR
jgi:beta-lactamase superfamily II metal-dependent hydrolase